MKLTMPVGTSRDDHDDVTHERALAMVSAVKAVARNIGFVNIMYIS
jgi:hypothetical protein